MINGTTLEFSGLFDLPGEGFVAQLRDSTSTLLYDKQGLQFLILQRKELGLEARVAEEALARINTLSENLAMQPV